MKINLGPFTTIEQASGTVWREAFTFEEADDLADFLECVNKTHGADRLTYPLQRLADMLRALTNDSAACIVTAGPDEEA
jgi:hypothetical protein